jgi:hypothetical protein
LVKPKSSEPVPACENFLSQLPSKDLRPKEVQKVEGTRLVQHSSEDPELEELDIERIRKARLAFFQKEKSEQNYYGPTKNAAQDFEVHKDSEQDVHPNRLENGRSSGTNFHYSRDTSKLHSIPNRNNSAKTNGSSFHAASASIPQHTFDIGHNAPIPRQNAPNAASSLEKPYQSHNDDGHHFLLGQNLNPIETKNNLASPPTSPPHHCFRSNNLQPMNLFFEDGESDFLDNFLLPGQLPETPGQRPASRAGSLLRYRPMLASISEAENYSYSSREFERIYENWEFSSPGVVPSGPSNDFANIFSNQEGVIYPAEYPNASNAVFHVQQNQQELQEPEIPSEMGSNRRLSYQDYLRLGAIPKGYSFDEEERRRHSSHSSASSGSNRRRVSETSASAGECKICKCITYR